MDLRRSPCCRRGWGDRLVTRHPLEAGPLRDRDQLRRGSRAWAPSGAWMLRRGHAAQRVPVGAGATTDSQLAVSDGQDGETHGHGGHDRGGGDTDQHDREWSGRHAGADQNSRGRGSQEPGVQEAHADRVALVSADGTFHRRDTESSIVAVERARIALHARLRRTSAMRHRHLLADVNARDRCQDYR